MPQYVATANTQVFGHELKKGETVALTVEQAARFDKLKQTDKAVVLEPETPGQDSESE